MPKYQVTLAASGYYETEVEAEDETEAIEIAQEDAISSGWVDWDCETCTECDA